MMGLKLNSNGCEVERTLKKLIHRMPENYIDEVEKYGQTVTMIAAKECFSFITEVMEQITADHINLVDKSGWTLLHHMLSNKGTDLRQMAQQKENICTLLSRISVEEKMVQTSKGLTLLMTAAIRVWDGETISAILEDTPPEYKNIQTKESLETAAMMYVEAKGKRKFPLDVFNLLISGVEETQMSLKNKNGCNLGYYACSFFVPLFPSFGHSNFYTRKNSYSDTNHIEINRSHANFLCELFERMSVEDRMVEFEETLLVMLLRRLPVKITPEFAKALKLLMKDTPEEWRMKGTDKTTPLMLACKHDCLLDDEIFDLLTKDMPHSYLEHLIATPITLRYFHRTEESIKYSTALRNLIKSSCQDKATIIIKLVSLLSNDHIYKIFEFGTYLMDFLVNYDDFAGIEDFVKACPIEKMNEWLLGTNELGDNILHIIGQLKSENHYGILNELFCVIPSDAFRSKNKQNKTPVMEFLRSRCVGGFQSRMFLQLNDGQKIVSDDDDLVNQRSQRIISKCMPLLVEQQMCYSLWIMNQVIYSDVIKHDDETTYASNINLTDEDMLDILPWTSVLFKYGPMIDYILLTADDEEDEEPDSDSSDFEGYLLNEEEVNEGF
eukprot:TRINITY_DN1771_c0_g1_i4.p1 TRINITY_DN1771_c0_g1~~TRINITY_DN1771_c0_g1_i4.p1  ORF type:complete len:610 (-),score=102.95 TRINITY_DN1771_c0_g1_i4:191-2020(-)